VKIVEDIAAVERRIAEVSGDAQPAAMFDSVLQQRLQYSATLDAPRSRAAVETLAQHAGARYNVAPELIVLREHRYHRNLKKNLGSITDHNSAIRHTILIRADIRNIL